MTILLLGLVSFLSYLVVERLVLDKFRCAIPMVIAVTGTRGKSSVVRMLASILREDGRDVLAKTTGSEAQFIYPDGTVQDVPRRGIVSILEQKDLLKKAARLHVDCLVVEIMSIRPENHFVESQQILHPDIVVVTNVRRDHVDAMGETEGEIARVLWNTIPASSSAYVLEQYLPLFDPLILTGPRPGTVAVRRGNADPLMAMLGGLQRMEFGENLDLVATICRSLGIADRIVALGILKAQSDIGKFGIWSSKIGGKRIYFVNAFAANDPESTLELIMKTRELLGSKISKFTGVLNLRGDRPDRTLQWIEALNDGMSARFERIYALGGHATVVKRRVVSSQIISKRSPAEITRLIASEMENDGVLFGFGNIGGDGKKLVEYWRREGTDYGI